MSIVEASISDESKDRYVAYALSVVTGRAIPDVRDGLKPVQRRILYAMYQDLNLKPNQGFRKSASVVGAVLAKYHPHGDTACYEAMVRLAQGFSVRYPLVDGQGNFGSIDGDSPAAYRYTEAKLLPLALEVIGEIHDETVAFRDNFDATGDEPVVFPSTFPHLLVNGAQGIAVGMATSIPPHNISEVIDVALLYLEDQKVETSELLKILKGPDFPTGCEVIATKKELEEIYDSGKGAVKMRATWKEETGARGKKSIIITSVPYGVNKSTLVEKIGDLVLEKKIPQLIDVRDESTDEVRVVLELANDVDPEVPMAYLFKHTSLELNFNVNLTALVPTESGNLKPEVLSLKTLLREFLNFRKEVTISKLNFEKRKLLARIHILEGLEKIFDSLDAAIKIVRSSDGRTDAATKLKVKFKLTDEQSFAVVDMRIYQLSKTNIAEIKSELKEKRDRISVIDKILKSGIQKLMKEELSRVKEQFHDKRRCRLITRDNELEFNAEDYVIVEDVFAVVTRDGWIKRIRQNNEVSSTRIREGDSILSAHPSKTTDFVLFFTNLGGQYALRVSDFPSSSGYGDPIQKHCKFKDGEMIVDSFIVRSNPELIRTDSELREKDVLVLVSEKGLGSCLSLEGLLQIRRSSRKVMSLRAGDFVVGVKLMQEKLCLITEGGYGLVVSKSEVPIRSGASLGVSLMKVSDKLVGIKSFLKTEKITLLLETGKEKEIPISEIQTGRRGLKGSKVISKGKVVRVL